MNSYIAEYVKDASLLSTADALKLDCARISNYYDLGNGYYPRAEARLWYDETGLGVLLTVCEEDLSITHLTPGSDVYKDSCAEFFFNIDPENCPNYMNLEGNGMGVLLTEIGPGRSPRNRFKYDPELLQVQGFIARREDGSYAGNWSLRYFLPESFLKEYFGSSPLFPGHKFRANFYKCGDEAPRPHYGTWNPSDSPRADFHRPQCFGEIILADK